MSLTERIGAAARKFLNPKELIEIPKGEEITVRTKAAEIETGERKLFTEKTRDVDRLKKFETIYKNDGVVSQLIDCIALHVIESGWNLQSTDKRARESIKEFLDEIDFDNLVIQIVRDALVFGDAFVEKVYNRGGQFIAMVPVSPKTMEIVPDSIGRPNHYTQTVTVDGSPSKKNIPPQFIMHIPLRQLGRQLYGESLIGANYDTIVRKAIADEGIAHFIDRHGFRKYHIKINKPANQVTEEAMNKTRKTFEKISSKNEFVTTEEVDIRDVDQGGTDIREVHEYFMDQLCAGFGVPEEIAGLGRGSTEATAKVRMTAFERTIQGYQSVVSSAFENLCFAEKLKELGISAKVKLNFMSISPDDEKDKAEWIATIEKARKGTFTVNEIREAMGYEPLPEEEIEEAEEEQEQPEEAPPEPPTRERIEEWKRERELAEEIDYE